MYNFYQGDSKTDSQYDVAIVVGGVIGVCSAYYLSSKGSDVSLIEKGEIASGCSDGNGGQVVPSDSIPLASPGALGDGLCWLLRFVSNSRETVMLFSTTSWPYYASGGYIGLWMINAPNARSITLEAGCAKRVVR